MFQTEFPFRLPKGYVDSSGTLHQEGVMRLATAADELQPLRDARVQSSDDPFLTVIILSRVVTQLGTLSAVNPKVIEGLFVEDLRELMALYESINGNSSGASRCPHCGNSIVTSEEVTGESHATPEICSAGR